MKKNSDYRDILKNTSIVGGSSAVNMFVSLIRNKIVALLIGPSGIGLLGVYNHLTTLVSTFFGMGVSKAGVREVAQVSKNNREGYLNSVFISISRYTTCLGIFGIVFMLGFQTNISNIMFDSPQNQNSVTLLSIAVFLQLIHQGNMAFLQGTRSVGLIARINIIGSTLATLAVIPVYYFLGSDGVVLALILTNLCMAILSRYSVKSIMSSVGTSFTWLESFKKSSDMIKLGFGLMIASLVTIVSTFSIRVIIVRTYGEVGAGYYHAAMNLSSLFVGFILSSMSTDYYPRLTEVSKCNRKVKVMVDNQFKLSLLIAVPGISFMIMAAPWIVNLLYDSKFSSSVPLLRWSLLGVLGQVISWPLGIIVLAKGRTRLLICIEAVSSVLHVSLVFWLINHIGIVGSGIAYLVLYIFHASCMIFIMKNLIGSFISRENFLIMISSIVGIGILFISTFFENLYYEFILIFDSILIIGITYLCIRKIMDITGTRLTKILTELSFVSR